jgi:hypothetical protein
MTPPKLPALPRPSSNYSKVPHVLVDWLPYLNETGLKVVYYILRHTWGWSEYDSPLALSLDEIANGIRYVTASGEQGRLDGGTGLSQNGVRDGLAQAIHLGLIEAIALDETPGKEQYAYRLIIEGGANSEGVQKMHPSVLKRVQILQGGGANSAPVSPSEATPQAGRRPPKESIKRKERGKKAPSPSGEGDGETSRNYLYEAVVKYIWEVEDYSLIPNGEQGRPGVIAGYLFQQYKCAKSTDPNDAGLQQAVRDLPDFVWWYRKEYPGKNLPYVGDKFVEHFAKWVTKGRPRRDGGQAASNGKPSPDQLERTRRMEKAMRDAEARGEL